MTDHAVVSARTMPILRIAMAVFLALWGVDKIIAAEGAQGIFKRFYLVDVGVTALIILGVLEIALAALLAAGLFRVPVAWIALVVNGVSTLASWKQILDPWGKLGLTQGGAHLFLASIVILAVNVVLVINARDAGRSAPMTEQ